MGKLPQPAITALAALREEYRDLPLREEDLAADPVSQFEQWLAEALAAGLWEPNAMTVATVDADGHPSARMVLLKGLDARGFTFFTNYDSRKGQQLAANPSVALVFAWLPLRRQVCVTGTAAPTSAEESDAYFASRPPGSRLGAIASPQSAVVPDRAFLERRLEEAEARYAEARPPRPRHWGGYLVSPDTVEFWQGRPNRLHDRLRYRRSSGDWVIERLAP